MNNRIRSLIQRLSRFGYRATPKGGRIDPVCGMEASSDMFRADRNGRSYYFCSDHCRQQFANDPERYISK